MREREREGEGGREGERESVCVYLIYYSFTKIIIIISTIRCSFNFMKIVIKYNLTKFFYDSGRKYMKYSIYEVLDIRCEVLDIRCFYDAITWKFCF